MNNRGGFTQSERGTIRIMGGDVYDARLNLIFVPVDAQELKKIIDLVEHEERVKNRRLIRQELERLLNIA